MTIEFIGMIGVRPEGADGAAVHVIGGEIDMAWVREFSQAHEARRLRQGAGGLHVHVRRRLPGVRVRRRPHRAARLSARPPARASSRPRSPRARRPPSISSRPAGSRCTSSPAAATPTRRAMATSLDHDTRYRRTDEYLGRHAARVDGGTARSTTRASSTVATGAYSDVKPVQRPHVPLYFGGASEAAHRIGVRHCDVYMLWGEPLAAIRERIATCARRRPRPSGSRARRGSASRSGRSSRPPRRRPGTKAHTILAQVRTKQGRARGRRSPRRSAPTGWWTSRSEADVHDKRLWTPIAAAVGGQGNTTALVGTPEQVAEALLDYYDLGVTTLLIRGFDPLNDAIEYGRELIPLVRDRGRPPRAGSRGGARAVTRLLAVVGAVTPPGRLDAAVRFAADRAADASDRRYLRHRPEPRRAPRLLRGRPPARPLSPTIPRASLARSPRPTPCCSRARSTAARSPARSRTCSISPRWRRCGPSRSGSWRWERRCITTWGWTGSSARCWPGSGRWWRRPACTSSPATSRTAQLTDPAARAGLGDLVGALVAMAGYPRDQAGPPPLAAGRG